MMKRIAPISTHELAEYASLFRPHYGFIEPTRVDAERYAGGQFPPNFGRMKWRSLGRNERTRSWPMRHKRGYGDRVL
jgi:hypothetical protein